MKKVLWLLLLFLPVVNAALLSDWPTFFVSAGKFSAKYVVGEEAPSLDVISATIISTSLARFENVTTEVGTSTLDTEIVDIRKYNAIVVGNPCENRAAAQLLNNPEPCFKDLAGSVGYIKLFESNGRVQLLITGLDEKDRHAAAKFLAEKNFASIKTKEYIVQSNSGSVPAFFEQKLKAKNVSNNVSVVNATPVVEKVTTANVTPAPQPAPIKNITFKKVKPGPYEPLEELPEKKGFFARLWVWLKSVFT